MNKKSVDLFAALPACALAVVLLLTAKGTAAQVNAKTSEAENKSVATTTVAIDGAQASAGTPGPQASQEKASSEPAPPESEEFDSMPLQVGDATQSLVAWQRSGEIASPLPRPIAGSIASRSYERYLKSFEFPIPERLNSTVTKSGGGSSGTSSGSR